MKNSSAQHAFPNFLLTVLCAASITTAEVVVYSQVPDLPTSTQYALTAGGKAVWVEAYGADNYAKFACDGSTEVEVAVSRGTGSLVVRPVEYVRDLQQGANSVRFTLIKPATVIVEDGESVLFVIADPIVPKPGLSKAAARVFGPGTHKVGTLNIGTGEVQIQAGAVVYGNIVGSGSARITGAGILDGSGITAGATPVIKLENGSGGLIEGITVRGAPWWAVVPSGCNGLTIKNVTITSCKKDGIDPLSCQNLKILNCTVKTPDDAISVKNFNDTPTRNLLVEWCTLAGTSFGDGFTIGFEVKKNDLGYITVRNCNILSGVGGNAVGGHSGFSIIADGPAPIHDVLFENITVETNVTKNFEIQITDGTKYPRFGTGPGHVRNVLLKNVKWKSTKALILKGWGPNNLVENVTFENCSVAGKMLKSTADASFTVNSYVKGLKFVAGSTGAVAIGKPLSISGRLATRPHLVFAGLGSAPATRPHAATLLTAGGRSLHGTTATASRQVAVESPAR